MPKTELKNCPFCDSGDLYFYSMRMKDKTCPPDAGYVVCHGCGGQGAAHESREDAVDAWNTRAQPDAEERLEAVRAALPEREGFVDHEEALSSLVVIYDLVNGAPLPPRADDAGPTTNVNEISSSLVDAGAREALETIHYGAVSALGFYEEHPDHESVVNRLTAELRHINAVSGRALSTSPGELLVVAQNRWCEECQQFAPLCDGYLCEDCGSKKGTPIHVAVHVYRRHDGGEEG